MHNFNEILNKLKDYQDTKTDASIAKSLGVTPQALSGFKKNNKFPTELLLKYCSKNNLSADWLFNLKGESSLRGKGAKSKRPELELKEALTAAKKNGRLTLEDKVNIVIKFLKSRKEYKELYDTLAKLLKFIDFMK